MTLMTERRVNKMLGATGFIDSPHVAQDMRELCLAYLDAKRRIDKGREALEAAQHSLTTLHGLYATDEHPSVSRNEGAEDGIDNHAIIDGIVERTWQIDESAVLGKIELAIAALERVTP